MTKVKLISDLHKILMCEIDYADIRVAMVALMEHHNIKCSDEEAFFFECHDDLTNELAGFAVVCEHFLDFTDIGTVEEKVRLAMADFDKTVKAIAAAPAKHTERDNIHPIFKDIFLNHQIVGTL